jgi:ubiquinone/menaquinone biosynthesis C-methylase UbiE
MGFLQTAERVSQIDKSDNYVYQRSLLAYVEAAKIVSGNVLEIGTGSGYGIEIVSPHTHKFTTVDKFACEYIENNAYDTSKVSFIQMTIPPLHNIADNSFDYVISFQVIEHIVPDDKMVSEVYRVLKPGGKFILTTPNKKTSLTRNPWHIREYTIAELDNLLRVNFQAVEKLGTYGNEKVNAYIAENKASVAKITKYDIFNLQYRLPRQLLQIPYDILNRLNRKKLLENNTGLVSSIVMEDFHIAQANDECLDLYYIAEKKN